FSDLSLETPLHDESDDTMMDTMRSDVDVEEIVSEKEESDIMAKRAMEFKGTLNDKEVFVFDNRVMAEDRITLQEIGERFQISRERVRQIECRVISKFKDQYRSELSAMSA
ncbi:MAG: RNA polymerase subunit sigma-70, partial [Syntrophus sp. (in: bacteria)]|nr:RNA polymerase subunit sigma-70 [Syntrophus sp. (in: bacteria)]